MLENVEKTQRTVTGVDRMRSGTRTGAIHQLNDIGMSRTAYALYSILQELSGGSGSKGKGYVYASRETLAEYLHCSDRTARKAIRELESLGLIRDVRMGQGLNNRIYLLDENGNGDDNGGGGGRRGGGRGGKNGSNGTNSSGSKGSDNGTNSSPRGSGFHSRTENNGTFHTNSLEINYYDISSIQQKTAPRGLMEGDNLAAYTAAVTATIERAKASAAATAAGTATGQNQKQEHEYEQRQKPETQPERRKTAPTPKQPRADRKARKAAARAKYAALLRQRLTLTAEEAVLDADGSLERMAGATVEMLADVLARGANIKVSGSYLSIDDYWREVQSLTVDGLTCVMDRVEAVRISEGIRNYTGYLCTALYNECAFRRLSGQLSGVVA